MPRGGKLSISTQACRIDAATVADHPEGRAGDFACFQVQDNGMGIPPENLPRIFDPFFTTKEIGKGTGLGLSTVYGIVKQHQGWIEVRSELGTGTAFQIFLPTVPAARPRASTPSPVPPPRGGKETILLVEDDEAVRTLTRRLLERYGYRVHEAVSGNSALDFIHSQQPRIDLLLTDVIMPEGINGPELAERLHAQNPRLKILFMSGYSGDLLEKNQDFVLRTQSRFLAKPCVPTLLLSTVRECLDLKVERQ
jgi:CheY-like chemotaxis protein